jgi:hypothetical protein
MSESDSSEVTRQNRLKDTIDKVLKTLTYREPKVIELRYGLDDDYTYTREEVGRIFKVTPDRVRQIEARAMRKLQHPVRSRQLEDFRDILATGDPTDPEGYFYLLQEVIGSYSNQQEPNLFDYATSELSQDAFVSWLIKWAEDQSSEINEPLHRTGALFLNRLLDLHKLFPPKKYEDLRLHTPYIPKKKYRDIDIRIDILVEVNSNIVVLIEDKIDHKLGNPLEDYLYIVRQEFENRIPVPVYLKTGDMKCRDQRDYTAVEQAGWKYFVRRDLLGVLAEGKRHGVASAIFRDFHSRLMHMDLKSWRNRVWRSRLEGIGLIEAEEVPRSNAGKLKSRT